jgi:diguanylate cyclase (GGDEF)-like protein
LVRIGSHGKLESVEAPVVEADPAIIAEVNRLLAGRTRDIRLNGEISRLFRARVWSQTAKIIRAWMIWVCLLDVVTLALNFVVLPKTIAHAMLMPAALILPVAMAVVVVWRTPRAPWIQGGTLIAGMFLILLSIALVGVRAGDELYERHLSIMLFVAITAIIIFGIPLAWTVAIAVLALGLYLVFELQNPSLGIGSAVGATLFFASGIFATVAARRTITILSQKTFLFGLRDRRQVAELAEANHQLVLLARTDPLTGIANRRWMTETLKRICNSDGKCPTGVAMLMCDIDDFKKLNDRLGHNEGDRCLIRVASILQENVRRDCDHVARFGGEEFLVVLPDVGERGAIIAAERIRQSVEDASIPNPASRVSRYVTLSIGVAVACSRDQDVSSEQLQRQADEALYLAKRAGRNRVVLHEQDNSGLQVRPKISSVVK